MAIAGGSTGAYLCYLDRDNNLIAQPRTSMRTLCFGLDFALTEVLNRKMVVVSNSDVTKLRELVKEELAKIETVSQKP